MLGIVVFDIARGSGKGPSSDDAIKSCRVCLSVLVLVLMLLLRVLLLLPLLLLLLLMCLRWLWLKSTFRIIALPSRLVSPEC